MILVLTGEQIETGFKLFGCATLKFDTGIRRIIEQGIAF